MDEQVRPAEEPTELAGHPETPADRLREMVVDLREKAEGLGYEAQGRVKELGDLAAGQIRYFSEQARTEAASRWEETSHRLTGMVDKWGANSRAAVRERPGATIGLAALAGFVLAMLGRRLFAGVFRR